jgi:hypothetical protein
LGQPRGTAPLGADGGALGIGLCVVLPAIAFASWLPKRLDFLNWLLTGSPGVWLLLCLVLVVVYGTLVAAFFIAQKRWFHPVLRDARRIGLADPVSLIKLMAEATSDRELRRRIFWNTPALLVSVIAACVAAYLSPSSLDAKLLLVMAVAFGLLAIWYVAIIVFKLRAERSLPCGPWARFIEGKAR